MLVHHQYPFGKSHLRVIGFMVHGHIIHVHYSGAVCSVVIYANAYTIQCHVSKLFSGSVIIIITLPGPGPLSSPKLLLSAVVGVGWLHHVALSPLTLTHFAFCR